MELLLDIGKDVPRSRKRRSSGLFKDAFEVLVYKHEYVKMSTLFNCVAYKGRRFWDPPLRKRVPLGEITDNSSRSSRRTFTYWGCQ